MTDLIVTQVDREAAADFLCPSAGGWFAAHKKQHDSDNETMRQLADAFARHRHRAIHEAELRGAGLMQEAAAKNIGGRKTTVPEDTVYLNLYTELLAAALRALDPATIIARATLTETSDDR